MQNFPKTESKFLFLLHNCRLTQHPLISFHTRIILSTRVQITLVDFVTSRIESEISILWVNINSPITHSILHTRIALISDVVGIVVLRTVDALKIKSLLAQETFSARDGQLERRERYFWRLEGERTGGSRLHFDRESGEVKEVVPVQ